jgi:CheY-like chemotaxis protein
MTRNRQCRVLIVEDRPETYELYSELLASAGYAVMGTDNGSEAYEQAVAEHPDLIVMDHDLPGGDGCDAAELIHGDPRTHDIPILMISGRATPEHLERARRIGCKSMLLRPREASELIDEVRRLVPESAPIVLVVEDDDHIRDALCEVLADHGFSVQTAANGCEAIDVLRGASERPQLILLDLMMPVMDGWAFRTAQLADPTLAQIPVVILSAVHNLRRQGKALRAADVLTKPIDVPRLLDAVERHV